ncbi:MAG: asparagine synthase (glutamine-hydrolyzing) [Chitinophagaceae bacterium]
MCGIAGIVSRSVVHYNDLKKMTDSIIHRGPDGEGQWINKEAMVGLGHRRLSIIDLSNGGAQPMHSEDGRYTITFNGEIYNYIELREQLLKKGYQFNSHSDTEVLLKLFIDQGVACLNNLDGMFAFAIWDEEKKQLFCARDRFGEKPFYYHFVPGKLFVFASEIKALKAYGLPLEFLPHRVGWYFNDNYALNNPAKQEETFYKDIFKLEAGFSLIIEKDIRIKKEKYWDINIDKVNVNISLEEAKDQFRYLFYESVKRRLRSDVPVGTSLSGGLDSSSVVCVISELLQNKGVSQKTFSARFKNFDQDEGSFIEEVIKGKDLQAFYTWPQGDELFSMFDKFMYHQEEPCGSSSQFAQWEVMKLARQENVTVLLDGQGADEVITGYSHYFDIYFNELQNYYPERFAKELASYVENINPKYKYTNTEKPTLSFAAKARQKVYPVYSKFLKPLLPVHKNQEGLLHPDFGHEANKYGGFEYFDYDQGLNNGLHHDAKKGKMEVLLRYGDKNSMAHSREVRLPFLSHELVEFVFSLPPWLKIHDGWSKFILRESMKDILPQKIAWRKDKIGYQTPQENWMHKDKFQNLLQDSIKTLEGAGIMNPKRKETNLQNQTWQILNTACLIRKFNS